MNNMVTIRLIKERVPNSLMFKPIKYQLQVRNSSFQKLPLPSQTIINHSSQRNRTKSIEKPKTIDATNTKKSTLNQNQYFTLAKKKLYRRISLLDFHYSQKQNIDMRGNRNCINNFLNSSITNCFNESSSSNRLMMINNNYSSNFRYYYEKRKLKESKERLKISHSAFDIDINANYLRWKVKKFNCLSKAGETSQRKFKINQDSHSALLNCCKFRFSNSSSQENAISLFGVYDGHGENGHMISRVIKRLIEDYFAQEDIYSERKENGTLASVLSKNNYKIIRNAFDKASDCLRTKKINATLSGTTCLLVFIANNKIICANVGDSRAVLYSASGKITELSKDHKPNLKPEYDRIIQNGGSVSRVNNEKGPYRVYVKDTFYPGLAMSRSIGDFVAESVGVISTPDFKEKTVNEFDSNYLVIGSDGLWEWLSSEEVGNIVKPFYKNNNCIGAVTQLMEIARGKWIKLSSNIDDITVMVIFFGINNEKN